jgi:tetratricopeptide (TPR) repeat protein
MRVALQYRAFVAYSRADASLAKWLHRWLEGFRGDVDLIGRDAAGTIHKTLRPIYRDRDDVTARDTPTRQTLAVLDASQALIVVCSPAAAASHYVTEVIRLFKSRHPERPVIPLIVDGRAGEVDCFPPSLRFKLNSEGKISDEPIEVVAADIREQGDGETLALAKVVAKLLGVSSDEVFQGSERGFRRAKREGIRRARIARIKNVTKVGIKGGIAAAFVAVVALTSVFAYFDYQRRQHLAAIDTLVAKYGAIDSAGTTPDTGPSVTDAISSIVQGSTSEPRYVTALELLKVGKHQEAEPLLQAVAEDKRKLPANSRAAAEAFRNLASLAAISDRAKARGYYAEAAALDPDHIEGMFWNGWFQAEAGSLNEAETAYRRVISTAKSGEDDWTSYWARLGIGDIRISRGDFSAAIAEYQAASKLADRFASDDAGSQRDLPIAYIKIGDGLIVEGNFAEALTSYRKGLTIIERLAKAAPDNAGWQRDLVASYGRVGLVLAQQGEATLALHAFYHGHAIASQLKEQFPDDAQLPKRLAAFDAEIAKLQQAKVAEPEIVQSQQVVR